MAIELPALGGVNDPVVQPGVTNPNAYASPAAQQAQRDYAKALMYGTVGKDGRQFPVVQSWTQGASNMLNALMGGLDSRNADQKDAARYQTAIPNNPAAPAPGGTPSPNDGPSSGGREKQADAGDDIDRAAKVTSAQESGGNYHSIGNQTHTGDRAYGKYQIMGANIPDWTKSILGKEMTPHEFLNDPQAQDDVYRGKMGEYLRKYGKDAGKAWFAGEAGMKNPNAKDVNGMTVARYGDTFARGMGAGPSGGGVQHAMAFAGPDGGSDAGPGAAPATQAITAALRGGAPGATPVAARGGQVAQNNLPEPNGNGIFYNPSLIKPPPQYTADQVRAMMASPELDPATKAAAIQQYRTQGQPIELPYPGGHIIVDPRNPTRQQFIPDLQKGTSKLEGVGEVPNYQTVQPPGFQSPVTAVPVPMQRPPGPQSAVTPPVAPAGAVAPPPVTPGGAVAGPGGTPAPNVASAAPTAPVAPAGAGPVAPAALAQAEAAQKPVQVASLDPNAAFAAAKPPVPGQVTAGAPAVPPVGPTPTNPLARLASGDEALTNMFGPELVNAMKEKNAIKLQQDLTTKKGEADIGVQAEASKDANKLSAKRYEDTMGTANAAADQTNNLRTARALTNDPNFYAGLASNGVEFWKRLKSAMGIDPDASAPMEVFKKTTAQSIMTGLKTAFAGLGQIRVAEIRLQELANASTANTPTAIKALLEINSRNAQKVQDIGAMATAYKNGEAIVDPKDPSKVYAPANKIDPATGEPMERTGLDSHWDKILQKFQKENPTFTDAEYDHFAEVLKGGKGEPEMPGKADAGKAGEAGPAVGSEKQFKQGVGVWDGKQYQPKKP